MNSFLAVTMTLAGGLLTTGKLAALTLLFALPFEAEKANSCVCVHSQ